MTSSVHHEASDVSVSSVLGFGAGLVVSALVISILVWVFSSRAQNYHHAAIGRQGTLIAFFGALIAGASPALINFFQGLGSQVR